MKKRVTRRLTAAQQRNQQEYEKTFRQKPTFTAGDEVFVTRLPFPAIADNDDETLARYTYNKRLQRATGPYKVLEVQQNTVDIDRDGIPNTVSIESVNSVTLRHDEATDARERRVEQKNNLTAQTHRKRPTQQPKGQQNVVYSSTQSTGFTVM